MCIGGYDTRPSMSAAQVWVEAQESGFLREVGRCARGARGRPAGAAGPARAAGAARAVSAGPAPAVSAGAAPALSAGAAPALSAGPARAAATVRRPLALPAGTALAPPPAPPRCRQPAATARAASAGLPPAPPPPAAPPAAPPPLPAWPAAPPPPPDRGAAAGARLPVPPPPLPPHPAPDPPRPPVPAPPPQPLQRRQTRLMSLAARPRSTPRLSRSQRQQSTPTGEPGPSPAEMHALAHERRRLARLDHEVGEVGAGDRRWHADHLCRAHVLPLRLAVREPHGARDDELEAALLGHALLNVVIAEEALQETLDEERPLEPARRGLALSDAVRGEDHQALHAVLLHGVDAAPRAAREVVGLLLDPTQ